MIHRVTFVVLMLTVLAGCHDDQALPPPVTPVPAPTTQFSGPAPTLTPEQVVRTVTEAMGENDTPQKDAGIATAFAFASPGNKQTTGPLARFITMVNHPLYAPLLNYAAIEYGPIRIEGDHAEQVVTVKDDTGAAAGFLFILTRQGEGEYEDCWMTDGVSRLGVAAMPPAEERDVREAPAITI